MEIGQIGPNESPSIEFYKLNVGNIKSGMTMPLKSSKNNEKNHKNRFDLN